MKREKLVEILDKHKKWLDGVSEGERANLRGANLREADLRYVKLREADLRYADLRYANLRGANLSNSDLRYVKLREADLTETQLNWANLEQVHGLDVIITQINTSVRNRQIKYIPSLNKVFVGCFSGTLEELKNEVEKTHGNNLIIKNRYLKAIKFIEEMAKDYEG